MKFVIKFLAMTVLSIAFMLTGCTSDASNNSNSVSQQVADSHENSSQITVKMLDIGQGDSILIETGEQTVLIDTGDVETRAKLLKELEKANVNHIDKMILSHPHADHIGGADAVLKNLTVGEIYNNGIASNSKLYLDYMKFAKEKKISCKALKEGDVLDFGNGVTFKVLFPTESLVKSANSKDKDSYKSDPNNESIVGMLMYKDFRMLFTGDSESEAEKKILAAHGDELKAQVLKSPHHGSKTSSNTEYLKKISPSDVLISLAAGNSYGHPHDVTLKKYEKLNANVYRTDQRGTITLVTDGYEYEIKGDEKK